MRADAEDLYGQRLGDIEGATNRIDGGFQRDDGASVKKVGTRHRLVTWIDFDSRRHTKEFVQRWVKLPAITERLAPTSAS